MYAILRRNVHMLFNYMGLILLLVFVGLVSYYEAADPFPGKAYASHRGASSLIIEMPMVDETGAWLFSPGALNSGQPGGSQMMSALPNERFPDGYEPKLREFAVEREKTAYLTFDDGPSEVTLQVLDVLRSRGVKATFFVVGTQIEKHPEILRRVHEEGHSIGNHTYSHRMDEVYRSPQAFLDSIMKNEDLIVKTVGFSSRLVRAPGGTYGNFTLDYYRLLDPADFIVHDWNVDSRDSIGGNVPSRHIVQQTLTQTQNKDRAVILMHDGIGKERTAEALGEIIDGLRQQGYSFAPLTDKTYPFLAPIKR